MNKIFKKNNNFLKKKKKTLSLKYILPCIEFQGSKTSKQKTYTASEVCPRPLQANPPRLTISTDSSVGTNLEIATLYRQMFSSHLTYVLLIPPLPAKRKARYGSQGVRGHDRNQFLQQGRCSAFKLATGTAYLPSLRLLNSGDDCRAWHKRRLFHQAGADPADLSCGQRPTSQHSPAQPSTGPRGPGASAERSLP